ncbi:phosphatase PAP2 family protein [Azospirillum sp. SYSU D00513]|uniref:phosphatase PAP2 family protein n=1 Tax=Azospirillum sp. SYSU D00513 TaxID=2812561 RepID=UPI001A9767CE|nr:phosphatase PAP2 family protein [Azospirillum sp. SYSU D00513]
MRLDDGRLAYGQLGDGRLDGGERRGRKKTAFPVALDWICRLDEAARGNCLARPANRTGPVAVLGRYAIKRHVLIPAFAGLWGIGGRCRKPRLRRAGMVGLAGLAGAALVNSAIKATLPRGRPDDCGSARQWGAGSQGRSFPSGHAGSAFAAATAVATSFEDPLVAGVAFGCAAVLSAGRVLRDRHWLSDVVAGALVGTAATLLAARLIVRDGRASASASASAPLPDPG